MKIDLADGELCLFEDRPLRVSGATGVYIYCASGTIWITTSDDPSDTFLCAGQRYQIGSRKLTLIESIGQARIRLEYPAPGRLASLLAGEIFNRTSKAASERDFPASPSA